MKKILITAFLSITFISCTAKRAEIFTQGQGSGLDPVSAWDKTLPITTSDEYGTSASTHAQEEVKVSANVKAMNFFKLVHFSVNNASISSLLGTPPFRGKPGTKNVYELKIKLTDKYLKFYKVALPENLPFEEHAYAEETLKDGRIMIPMVGYKINGYFRIEAAKTSDDLDSHHLTEIAELDHSKATHVRIDWNSREYFQAVKTADLIPAGLFFSKRENKRKQDQVELKPFEWYYSETVTEKSLSDDETIIGETPTHSEVSALIPATKVVIIPSETELRVVNVARDERLDRDQSKSGSDVNSEPTLIIPVQWSEYRIKRDGVSFGLEGEENTDRNWDQRSGFQMDLQKITSAGITSGMTRLLDIQVDKNYFSFTVLNTIGSKGRKIHYSFLRADQGRAPYEARRSFIDDQSLFGFFTTVKPFTANWEYYTENDFNRRIYISRMNPDSKEIVFHLSTGSLNGNKAGDPDQLENIAEKAVAAWDKTFQEALKGTGKEIRIRFARGEPVQLGDLRYNVIHMVETLNEDGLLGYGPSVADPETGEIISATTNVYVNSTKSIAASTIRQYMIDRLEKRLPKNTKNGAPNPITVDPMNPPAMTASAARVLEEAKALDGQRVIKAPQFSKEVMQDALKKTEKDQCLFGEYAMMNANDTDILNYCPEIEKVVSKYESLDFMSRKDSAANWESVWSGSKKEVNDCATQLMRGKLLSTIIHEMGHNFGLRHNFAGSVDKDNFKKMKTIFGEEITANTSSIMEYTDWAEDRLTEAGPYDVAAIRFAYGAQVENKDGKLVNVDQTRSLDSNALKPYQFCTDEVAHAGLSALCRTDDAGTNPLEVVNFYISKYKRSEALRKFRRVRTQASDPDLVAQANLTQIFTPMKNIYDEWRYELGEFVRKSQRYLSDYDVEGYQRVLDAMKADPQYGPIYDQYHDAANLVYDFFKQVAFGPNQYCLIQEENGEKRAIELERLRDLLSESTRGLVAIRTCEDVANASDFAKVLNAKSPVVLQEVGYPLNSYKFEKPETYRENLRNDVVGNNTTRLFAGLMIHHRMDNLRNEIHQFAPNMTDEPNHYDDFSKTLNHRITQGVDLSAFKIDEAQPLFRQEAGLIAKFARAYKLGLYTPGEELNILNQVVTYQKLAPLTVYRPTEADNVSKFAAALYLNGRYIFAARNSSHKFTMDLINRFNAIDGMLGVVGVSAQDQEQISDLLMQVFPPSSELGSKTVQDFVTEIKQQQAIEEVLPAFAACFEAKVPALAQVNVLLPAVIADFSAATKEGGTRGQKAFMAQNLVSYLSEKLDEKSGKELLFTRENLNPLAAAMEACAKEQAAISFKVDRNRKDYESQKSLILDVLDAYAN